jgi:hypothetical protein
MSAESTKRLERELATAREEIEALRKKMAKGKIDLEVTEPKPKYPQTTRYRVKLRAYWVEKNGTRTIITRILYANAESKNWAIGQAKQLLKLEIPRHVINPTIQTISAKKANYEINHSNSTGTDSSDDRL